MKHTITFELYQESEPYRKSKKDYIYYNSDLNKYIGDELPRIMTSIDVDLLQYKKSKNIIRICEYKHIDEKLGYQQDGVLYELAKAFKMLNDNSYSMKFEVMILRGNYPFDNLEIYDLIKKNKYIIEGKENVNKFLCVEN